MSVRTDLYPETQAFSFFINGGIDKKKLLIAQIHTLKYLASTFEQNGFQEGKIEYSRKFLSKELELKTVNVQQWVHDCCIVGDFYASRENYAQAVYCFKAAASLVLASDVERRQLGYKMYLALGHCYREQSFYEVALWLDQKHVNPSTKVNWQFFKFDHLPAQIDFPQFDQVGTFESCTMIIEQALKTLQ